MTIMPMARQKNQRDSDRERDYNENPWTKVVRTVRKVDEDKVKDCTDDIDTLLVFAGLYSAVLTAFLIESYKNLFADENENLLRQIAYQTANYTFNNGYLNSTFNPSQLPSFKAAVSDIRVNVCWFASLILSLASASLGIAIKQWLHEFLSIDCISPQERLRIRDARIHGLRDWKLFQIAAFLPVLLQVSLVLFFVGLCFFTAAVHPSIGTTSLFLVICWAFLFFMSVLAPLFSPRCPYKTTILKVPFRYARPHIRAFFGLGFWQPAVLSPKAMTRVPSSEENQGDFKEFQYYDDCMDIGILSKLMSNMVVQDTPIEEEDVIRSTDRNDLIVLRNIDCDFFDDNLLGHLPGAISQRPPPLRDVLQFAKAIVHHRIKSSLSTHAAVTTTNRNPWPWTLSYSARSALADMLARTMQYELHRGLENWETLEAEDTDWSRSFVFLTSVVSTRETLPDSVLSMLRCGNEHRKDNPNGSNIWDIFSLQVRTTARSHPDWPARSLLFLAQSVKTLKAEDAAECVGQITYNTFIEPIVAWQVDAYRRLIERDPSDNDGDIIAPTPQRIVALLEVARVILHNVVLEQAQSQDSFPRFTSLLLEFVLDVIPRINHLPDADFDKPLTGASDGPGLYRVLTDLFTAPRMTRPLLHFLATRSRFLSPSSQPGGYWFLGLIGYADYTTRVTCGSVLYACAEFFMAQATSTSAPLVVDSPATVLRLCLLIYHFPTQADDEFTAYWEKLFTAAHACFKRITQRELHPDPSTPAWRCVGSNEEHTETCEVAYAIFKLGNYWAGDHRFSNELINFLRTMVCPRHTFDKDGHKLNLIKRLEEAEVAAETAASDILSAASLVHTIPENVWQSHRDLRASSTPWTQKPQSQPDAEITMHTDPGPDMAASEHTPSLDVPAFVRLSDDEALDGDTHPPLNKHVKAVFPLSSHAVGHAGREDEDGGIEVAATETSRGAIAES